MAGDKPQNSEFLTLTNVQSSPDGFINRQDALDRLEEWFLKQEFRFACIYGEAGIGKTYLAKEFVYQLARKNVFYSIVWTTAKEKELTVKSSALERLGRRPQVKQEKSPASRDKTLVQSLDDLYRAIVKYSEHPEFVHMQRKSPSPSQDDILMWLRIRKILIVIDDLDGWMDEWGDVLDFVEKIRPPSAVLMTSRYQLDRNSVPGLAQLILGPLSNSHAETLLRNIEEERGISLNPDERKEIIAFSNGNPLLIRIAAGLIPKRARKREALRDILKRAGKNQTTVQFLFDRIYAQLTVDAQRVALAIAIANDEGMPDLSPDEIASICEIRPSLIDGAINELRMASFIDRDPKDNRQFDMHKLAVDFIISRNPALRKQFQERTKMLLGRASNLGLQPS